MRSIHLFYSKSSDFNEYILQIIQMYNLSDIKTIDYDVLKYHGKVNLIPKELTIIPGIAIYEDNFLTDIYEGPNVFSFLKGYYSLPIKEPPIIKRDINNKYGKYSKYIQASRRLPRVNETPYAHNYGSNKYIVDTRKDIKNMDDKKQQEYFSKIHKNIKGVTESTKGKSHHPLVDNEAKKMIPTTEDFQFMYYNNAKTKKDNYCINGSLHASKFINYNRKNHKFYETPKKSIIEDIKKLPKDNKTGQPIEQDSSATRANNNKRGNKKKYHYKNY